MGQAKDEAIKSEEEKYEVTKIEVDEDDAWEASDWCYVVRDGGNYVCICATMEEAERICALLNDDEEA